MATLQNVKLHNPMTLFLMLGECLQDPMVQRRPELMDDIIRRLELIARTVKLRAS